MVLLMFIYDYVVLGNKVDFHSFTTSKKPINNNLFSRNTECTGTFEISKQHLQGAYTLHSKGAL